MPPFNIVDSVFALKNSADPDQMASLVTSLFGSLFYVFGMKRNYFISSRQGVRSVCVWGGGGICTSGMI